MEYVNFLIYCSLIVISLKDISSFLIPNHYLVILGLFILVHLLFIEDIMEQLFFAILVSIFLVLFYFVTEKIGGGDIKLLILISFWLNSVEFFVSIYIAIFSAIIYGFINLLFKKDKNKIPLAPFIATGSILSHFFTLEILSFYYDYFY